MDLWCNPLCKKCWFLADTLSVFQGERDLGDKDKSVDLQLSPYQSMRRLGSVEF